MSIRELRDSALPENDIALVSRDRRKRLRFPLDTEMRFQRSGRGHGNLPQGTGRVANISSLSLAFQTDELLEPGVRLGVSMAWAAKLDGCMLRLVFEGVILRTRGDLVVVTIERPEFRTAGKSSGRAREEISTMARCMDAMLPSKGVPRG